MLVVNLSFNSYLRVWCI